MFTNQFFQTAIENMINGFAAHRIITDEQGKPIDYEFMGVNQAFENYTGLRREEIIGKTIREVSPDIDKDEMDWIGFYGDVALTGKTAVIERYSRAFGRWYNIHVYSPGKGYFVTIFNDITELKNKEKILFEKNESLNALYEEQTSLYEELTASEEELRQQNDELIRTNQLLADNERRSVQAQKLAQVGNWEVDLKTGMLWGSEGAFWLYGLERENPYLPLEQVQQMIHRDDQERREAALKGLIEGTGDYELEFKIIRPDGQERYMHSIAEVDRSSGETPSRVLGVVQDITARIRYENELRQRNEELSSLYEELMASEEELKENFQRLEASQAENRQQQKRLQYMAYRDGLTGLPNRELFMERMGDALDAAKNQGSQLAAVFMDVDNFKDVNDTRGHHIGDELLKAIAVRLSENIFKREVLARLGGDEFSILIPDFKYQEEVFNLCETIREKLKEPFELDGCSFHITVSIGIAFYPEDGNTREELLKNADTAMYRAKEAGKDNVQAFHAEMKYNMMRRIAIENGIRRTLKSGEFMLHYQPQVELKTGAIRSLEALLRWHDAELGVVPPLECIPIAEESGLIVPLGEWVLREACKKGAEWNRTCAPKLLVSVNVSATQLKQGNFVAMVREVLRETEFSPAHLELEITESLLIQPFEQTVATLGELRNMGIKVSMDDFGTGYSSLNNLKRLPLDTLKIDKSFIHDIENGIKEKEFASSIVSLVQKLQIEIVAEGVETEKQLEYLLNCNCDNIQGYLLSGPVPENKVEDILKKDFLSKIKGGDPLKA